MAALSESEFRTVIEDARARHAAVVALMYVIDTQSMSLLRLYVTLGIAAVSGAAAGMAQSLVIAHPLAWAFAAAAFIFVFGAAFCLRALQPTAINLPGRKADFWKWALQPDVSREAVLISYLDNLEAKGAANDICNARAANALKWAKRCGAAAPFAAMLAGLIAQHCNF